MTEIDLKKGDIIIAFQPGSDFAHAHIWIGGEIPLVHSVPGKESHTSGNEGIVREKGTNDERFRLKKITVFSPKDISLGIKAASIAEIFSLPVDPDLSPKTIYGSIFGYDRLSKYTLSDCKIWGNEQKIRALRAYYRYKHKQTWFCVRLESRGGGKLNNVFGEHSLTAQKGITCSQFVTYVYQAAIIDTSHTDIAKNLEESQIDQFEHQRRHPIVRGIRETAETCIPKLPKAELVQLMAIYRNTYKLPKFGQNEIDAINLKTQEITKTQICSVYKQHFDKQYSGDNNHLMNELNEIRYKPEIYGEIVKKQDIQDAIGKLDLKPFNVDAKIINAKALLELLSESSNAFLKQGGSSFERIKSNNDALSGFVVK